MMGIMVPETCWANNKFCNKETNLLHLVCLLISAYSYGYLISSISVHCKNISVYLADQQRHTGKILYVYHMLFIATCIGRCCDHHQGVLFYLYIVTGCITAAYSNINTLNLIVFDNLICICFEQYTIPHFDGHRENSGHPS